MDRLLARNQRCPPWGRCVRSRPCRSSRSSLSSRKRSFAAPALPSVGSLCLLESISLESPESVLSWASYSVFVFGPGVAIGGVAVLARVSMSSHFPFQLGGRVVLNCVAQQLRRHRPKGEKREERRTEKRPSQWPTRIVLESCDPGAGLSAASAPCVRPTFRLPPSRGQLLRCESAISALRCTSLHCVPLRYAHSESPLRSYHLLEQE